MDFLECIKKRRSVRDFTDREIEVEVLNKIVEATSYSPSWKNSQTIRYNIVRDKEKIKEIADKGVLGFAYNTNTLYKCKAIAVQSQIKGICGYEKDGSYSTPKKDGWEMYDAGVSAQSFCLSAHYYGVGTVIMGMVDDKSVKEILNLPDNEVVTSIIAMGYSAEEKDAPKRKNVDELLRII